MNVRHAYASRNSGDLGIVPFNRESEWRGAEYAEFISVVVVFPDILSREDQVAPQGLLQAHVELIAPAGAKGRCRTRGTDQKRIQHRVRTACAGEYQVLVKRGFQYSRV